MPQSSAANMPYTNKLYQTLQCFDAGEVKRLRKFMESSFFNQSVLLRKLCEMLLERVERGQETFVRAEVWKKLQPGAEYDDVNFRKYCSDLLKLIERFLVHDHLQHDAMAHEIGLLRVAVQRKITPLYGAALRQVKSGLERQPYLTMRHYFQAYEMERLYFEMMEFDVKIDVKANLESISLNLDTFYWIEKLKIRSSAISQLRTGNFEYRIDFIDQIKEYLRSYDLERYPELALYYYSFLTLHEEEEVTHYHNFKRMLERYGNILPAKEAIEMYDVALHYCTGKLNRGDRAFMLEYFELFERGIEKGIFLVKGELAPWRYNNAVGVALGLGKLDWAEQFVEQYRAVLPAANRDNTYAFNLARIYRFQGKFQEVLELLRDLDYEDIGYNLLSKRMLVMTYYDLDEFDALESFIESFRVFLNRHKDIPQPRRKGYLNWLKYVRKLTRLISGDKAGIEKLREEVLRNRSGIASPEWLLEKLNELA